MAGSSAHCVHDCSNNLTHARVLSMAVSSQPNAQTDVQLGCFCTAKRTRSRSQHPSSLSCLSSQLQGRDFKLKETTSFGLIRPQTRFTLRHWAGQGGHFKQGKKNESPSHPTLLHRANISFTYSSLVIENDHTYESS